MATIRPYHPLLMSFYSRYTVHKLIVFLVFFCLLTVYIYIAPPVTDRGIRSQLANSTRPPGFVKRKNMCYYVYYFCAICVILASDVYVV
jgi:hypothetical protein